MMLVGLTAGRQRSYSRPADTGRVTAHDAAPLVTLAARAWEAWLQGHAAQARSLARAASSAARQRPRRQRQQIQIVQLAVEGDWERASGLAAEHLAEFPGDQLIRSLLATASGYRRSL
jgi:hypothetical protein